MHWAILSTATVVAICLLAQHRLSVPRAAASRVPKPVSL